MRNEGDGGPPDAEKEVVSWPRWNGSRGPVKPRYVRELDPGQIITGAE
ncbi:MAG: hypothetical protein QW379_05230 [Thermoplasmata archaeon]